MIYCFDNGHVLTVSDPNSKLEVVRRLLEHSRSKEKRPKLIAISTYENGYEV